MNVLGSSTSIGFWSKHSLIMDQIYEIYELDCEEDSVLPTDAELERQLGDTPFVKVVKENRDRLEQMLETAVSDAERVDFWIRDALVKRMERVGIVTGRGQSNWGSHVWVKHRDGRRSKLPRIQLGWHWETGDLGLELRAWLWSKGGSAARDRAASYLLQKRCITEQLATPISWQRATLPLAIVPVIFDDGFRADLDAVAASVLDAFKWLNSERLEGLLMQLKQD